MCKGLWCAAIIGAGVFAGAGTIHAVAQPAGHVRGDHGAVEGHGPLGAIMAHLHRGHCEQLAALHEEMNLSDEQLKALHETLRSHHAEIATAIRPVLEAKQALHAAILADTTEDAKIRGAGDALGKAAGDAAIVFAKIKVEAIANAKLTPGQLNKLAEIRTSAHESIDSFLNELEGR